MQQSLRGCEKSDFKYCHFWLKCSNGGKNRLTILMYGHLSCSGSWLRGWGFEKPKYSVQISARRAFHNTGTWTMYYAVVVDLATGEKSRGRCRQRGSDMRVMMVWRGLLC
jgi:hypothetical protein